MFSVRTDHFMIYHFMLAETKSMSINVWRLYRAMMCSGQKYTMDIASPSYASSQISVMRNAHQEA